MLQCGDALGSFKDWFIWEDQLAEWFWWGYVAQPEVHLLGVPRMSSLYKLWLEVSSVYFSYNH